MTATHGAVCAPVPVAPVHETARGLFPEGRHALQRVAQEVGLDRRGASGHLDGGFDSRAHRTCMVKAGMIPHITEPPAIASTPSADGSGGSTPPATRDGCVSSAPGRGRTHASDSYSVSNVSSSGIMA